MGKKEVKEKIKVIEETPTGDKEIAMDFATKAHQKFDRLIRASILFGSQAKGLAKSDSDIDIVFVIDDASINWDLELISWYREELSKLIASNKHSKRLHINTIKLTTFWQDLMHGDPVILNILRYGEPLIDVGAFFVPIKALMERGRIKPTPEAVYSALQRAPSHLARSKAAEMGAIEGVYWTMVDSAQAAIIMAGHIPPSPEHIPNMLKELFVDKGKLSHGYVRAFNDLYLLHKDILYGKVVDIKGSEIDQWQTLAERFLSEMTRLIDEMIEIKKHLKK
ncbi:MAG: nucleotidyltransferase domain-containing protein [Candidatus Pacearchaeota archaeon]|nr:nucleotidyltransferase domain-containing protein [Candidatus Pacearchaeota archaeon]